MDFEDYCLQQEVPEHFKDHSQAHGSQIRYIIPSDLEEYHSDGVTPVKYSFMDKGVKKELSAEEFKKEYEDNIYQNIQESIQELSQELGLGKFYTSIKDRNIALSKILQREILSSPRYGIDLLIACSVDEATGEFRIPLGDPIQSKRVEQLINSIIKNRINKQKIAGGPIVQVSNFGTSKELNIRFNDKNGNLLMTKLEYAEKMAEGAAKFKGGRRRSEVTGITENVHGDSVVFIDDYGHHPTAIRTTLAGYREFYKGRKIIVDFMSHTYSRTASLFDEFAFSFDEADEIIFHKIYSSARENADDFSVTGEKLYERAKEKYHEKIHYFNEIMDSADFLEQELNQKAGEKYPAGYLFVTMGAGDNWKIGHSLFDLLQKKKHSDCH